jgi:hypothetical protein|tara:strand:- start:100 stop:579 length:480 start_codon:yes stop_codon:yes gene_type:complete
MAKNFKTVRITPTSLNATSGAVDEVIFNPTEITNAVAHNGGASLLKSITVIDYDDNSNMALDLYFFQLGTNDLGTLGGVIDISDAELLANKSLGRVQMSAVADGTIGDMILSRIYTVTGIDLVVQAESDSSSIFVGAVCQASMVSTTSGTELILGFEQL